MFNFFKRNKEKIFLNIDFNSEIIVSLFSDKEFRVISVVYRYSDSSKIYHDFIYKEKICSPVITSKKHDVIDAWKVFYERKEESCLNDWKLLSGDTVKEKEILRFLINQKRQEIPK